MNAHVDALTVASCGGGVQSVGDMNGATVRGGAGGGTLRLLSGQAPPLHDHSVVVRALRAQAGNQGAGGVTVIFVFSAEGLAHEFFFHSEFDGEGQPEEDDCYQTSGIGAGEGGTDHAENHAGINGVANP